MDQNSNSQPSMVGELLRYLFSGQLGPELGRLKGEALIKGFHDMSTPDYVRAQMRDQGDWAQRIEDHFRPAIPEYPIEGPAPGYFGRGMQVRMG